MRSPETRPEYTRLPAVKVIASVLAAAVLVATRPRIGAYVVAAWLLGIILNLLLIPGYFDVALRDFGLALGALALARLSEEFEERPVRV